MYLMGGTKMNFINESTVLNFYLKEIDKDAIEFLKNKLELKASIKENVIKLREVTSIHEKIETSKKLWKLLFEAAMSYIDPDMRGYDELFKYFDEYVVFEELIFASDSFYRDHTIHCLWVYFLGEYLVKAEEFKEIFKNVYQEINGHLEVVKAFEGTKFDEYAEEYIDVINKMNIIRYEEAMRCVAALTHDLGYPIKKINKINSCIGKMLPYFSIKNYDEFDFNYNPVQSGFIEEFIKFMTLEFTFSTENIDKTTSKKIDEVALKVFKINEETNTISGVYQEELDKLNSSELELLQQLFTLKGTLRDNLTARLRYLNDFEEYQHGIMSAFLLVKTVKAFRNTNFRYRDNVNVNLSEIDMKSFVIKSQILTAISNHTSDGYQIKSIETISEVLTLVDELEEFSRISRANLNRQFIREFCKSNIYYDNGVLNIDFVFDNESIDNLDPERAFKGRCKRFLTLFDIKNLSENLNIKLSCIGDLSYNKNTYTIEIKRKYANITINGLEQNIPKYLSSKQFYTKEGYMSL